MEIYIYLVVILYYVKMIKFYVIGEHKKIETFFKKLGKFQDKIRNPLIIGGGRITHYLVNIIDKLGVTSKIIEFDMNKCIELK